MSGYVTTDSMGPLKADAVGTMFAKDKAIFAGAKEVLAIAEISGLTCELLAFEGNWVGPQEPVLRLMGSARVLLSIERVCLNIVQRMSGIATMTFKMMDLVREGGPKVVVAATRKTTPGFRYFEKRAVTIGGGDPHRYALDDMVLIKNNHIAVVGGISTAIRSARDSVSFSKKISCEVRSLSEAIEAVQSGADIILLDNFSPKEVEKTHKTLAEKGLRERVLLESSGGINESNIKDYAASGTDIISSGALTHSYASSDFNILISLV
ncbi:MAG: carboxylating nicotinate-nucleotide diphosphorylase [Candidatus Thorarchaeota archaeon]|jgi:nicotinate-nucleotide pyrophosphorylase (carboxylating)